MIETLMWAAAYINEGKLPQEVKLESEEQFSCLERARHEEPTQIKAEEVSGKVLLCWRENQAAIQSDSTTGPVFNHLWANGTKHPPVK